jgi:chromate transport protein ChrA
LIVFLKQAFRVSGGFWIKVKYPDVILDILSFNFTGMIESKIIKAIIFIVASLLIVYIAINIIKNKKKDKNISVCIWAISIYFGVIILSLLLSFVTDIFTTRYTLPMIGLLVFAISYVCSLENKKWVLISFMSIIVILFGISTYNVYLENYDNSNKKLEDEINNVVQEGDIFIYREIGAGSVVAIKYPNNKQYYYNAYHWTVEEAYKAYAPQMETVEDLSVLDNIKGRIIVIDDGSTALYDELKEKENIETIKKPEKINMKYKNLNYTISILNKIN